ncbi:COG3650 family protein [Vibrio sp. TRT 21S02]|uniref:COG3650 family protein n=1 Tax=Vibrio sp. TRT 21S02 TaxID=3418507 RepID=UPI003CF3ED73
MKALRSPVAVLTMLALQACSTSTPVTESAPVVNATLDNPETIQPQTFVMRGEVVLGHEVRAIKPCGSNKQYWLGLDDDRFNQAMTLVRSPYQPLYGEVIGYLKPPSEHGFDSDYTANIHVTQVNLLSAENPDRCALPENPTQAFGNEPSWSASFTQDGLMFQPLGADKQQLKVESSRITESSRRYELADGNLELTQRSCVDNMSDSLYGWQAQLNIKDKRYKGCATVSNLDSTREWVGLYHAASTQNLGFSINLELLADHTAVTTYKYSDNQPDTVERGYWQQLNPEQIQVTMTHHQQQRLLSERIFSRDGYQLIAEKEKVGSVVYPIADGGLILFRAKSEATTAPAKATSQVDTRAKQVPSSAEYNSKVDQAVRRYFKLHRTSPENTQYRWLTYDLNGDGKQELLTQLDWCGSGGCTLLIFENHQDEWRFNSRVTLVNSPMFLGSQNHEGWQDLIFYVSGGGAQAKQHRLQYSGVSYPLNPSVAPVATPQQISAVKLFSDGISPRQQGVKL